MLQKKLKHLEHMLKAKGQKEAAEAAAKASALQAQKQLGGVDFQKEEEAQEWSLRIQDTIQALKGDATRYKWPRDVLFQYLRLLYDMHENMQEYEELQCMASHAVLTFLE